MTAEPPSEWGTTDPIELADTTTSHVTRVRLARGGTAVIKQLKPIGTRDELVGADLLEWRDGRGYVRLLARSGSTLLLEDAGDRSLLDHLGEHGDEAATRIAAEALRTMHAPMAVPPPPSLPSLDEWFESLFAMADVRPEPLLADAAHVARELLASQADIRPLHGDFHHENLFHTGRGWLAIDPKGLLGDPGYDAGNLFYNPLERDDLRLSPARIRSMAAILARALDRDTATILRWAFVHACLSASWHLEDSETAKAARSLTVGAGLQGVLRASG